MLVRYLAREVASSRIHIVAGEVVGFLLSKVIICFARGPERSDSTMVYGSEVDRTSRRDLKTRGMEPMEIKDRRIGQHQYGTRGKVTEQLIIKRK